MKIPPDLVGEISQLYQMVKRLTMDVLSECHDPDYEATQENVRRLFSRLEEEAFQLRLFEESEPEAAGERAAA